MKVCAVKVEKAKTLGPRNLDLNTLCGNSLKSFAQNGLETHWYSLAKDLWLIILKMAELKPFLFSQLGIKLAISLD